MPNVVSQGFLWKDVHSHRLFFAKLHCHWCDMCRQRINNGSRPLDIRWLASSSIVITHTMQFVKLPSFRSSSRHCVFTSSCWLQIIRRFFSQSFTSCTVASFQNEHTHSKKDTAVAHAISICARGAFKEKRKHLQKVNCAETKE